MRTWREAGRGGLRRLFEMGQRLGFDLLPRHFYSSIPDIAHLRKTRHWRSPHDLHGVVGTEIHEQIAFLEDLCPQSITQDFATLNVHAKADQENGQGGGYGVIEADVLHAFVCRHRPRHIVQVGCGVSTSVIMRAAAYADYQPNIVCVEPFPSPFLIAAERSGLVKMYRGRAEECPREILTGLGAGDLLFVDSTHTVMPGSEVNRIILDVMPRLLPGVFVHFHDIYFPFDYERGLLSDSVFFPVESTLLHAFLIGNRRCRVLLSLSMLHYEAPQAIAKVIPHYDPEQNSDGLRASGGKHFPSAIFLLTG